MNRLIAEYQELIELLYDRLGHLEILQFPSFYLTLLFTRYHQLLNQ